jgi:hypothetical protein
MIHQSDLIRTGSAKENPMKVERKLRRQEGLLTYEMMRKLTTEIRRLQKCNEFLIKKLEEANGKSLGITSTELEENGLSMKMKTEEVKDLEESIKGRFDEDKD